MDRVFVTGATGFIGRQLVAALLRRGIACRCLVRTTSNADDLRRPGVELVFGRLDEPERYRKAIRDCDVVFHAAGMKFGRPAVELNRINGAGCAELADVCRALDSPPRLVYLSSLAAAGPPPTGKALRDEHDPPRPISQYGESKRMGESLLEKRCGDLPISVIRPGIVFGPGDTGLAAVYRSIYRFHLHLVVGLRHTPALSLIHVDDLIGLMFRAAEHGEVLDPVTTGQDHSTGYYFAVDDDVYPDYRELGRWIGRALDCPCFILPMTRRFGGWFGHAAGWLSELTGRPSLLNRDKIREATVDSWACSGDKARNQLGFAIRKPLFERLQETGQWYIEHGWI